MKAAIATRKDDPRHPTAEGASNLSSELILSCYLPWLVMRPVFLATMSGYTAGSFAALYGVGEFR